jgi:hypothetical protein
MHLGRVESGAPSGAVLLEESCVRKIKFNLSTIQFTPAACGVLKLDATSVKNRLERCRCTSTLFVSDFGVKANQGRCGARHFGCAALHQGNAVKGHLRFQDEFVGVVVRE